MLEECLGFEQSRRDPAPLPNLNASPCPHCNHYLSSLCIQDEDIPLFDEEVESGEHGRALEELVSIAARGAVSNQVGTLLAVVPDSTSHKGNIGWVD